MGTPFHAKVEIQREHLFRLGVGCLRIMPSKLEFTRLVTVCITQYAQIYKIGGCSLVFLSNWTPIVDECVFM